MGRAERIQSLTLDAANRLDSSLDAPELDLVTWIALMECRDALRKYGGLHDVCRIRKAIERFVSE